MILSVNNIEKSFGITKVLENVTFQVNDNEKLAIVGVNGAGKSTLFKIIINELPADQGSVNISKDCKIGYLAQHEAINPSNNIYEEVLSVKSDIIELEEAITQIGNDMKSVSGSRLEQMMDTYSRLTHEFESKNGYAYKSEVIGVLKGLGFNEETFNNSVGNLSGGEKTRVALGKLLLSNPNLLLLDEPTNHLDLETISWLENYLSSYKGAVIVISHDRYFLDKLVTKIIEIENKKATVYNGAYSVYANLKSKQQETRLKQYVNQQKEIKRQEDVISQLRRFNREKSIKRAESREKALSKVERLEKPYEFDEAMAITFEPSIKSGNDVLSVTNLSKSYNNHTLFDNINFEIKRGEHLAIIGDNGTGKSTILKIINKFEKPDNGNIKLGEKVRIAYYDQEQELLNLDNTIFNEIQDEYPHLNNTSVRNVLASFLFTGEDVFKKIGSLSGGERGRVSLAKLMLSEANFLIMDEPTNHLDITSKEVLENALNKYSGTVLYVSHDRYFINKTASRILDLTNQIIINYLGNYDYYIEKKPDLENTLLSNKANSFKVGLQGNPIKHFINPGQEEKVNISVGKSDWLQQKEEQARKRKFEAELKQTESQISKLENRSQEIDQLLTKEEIYTNVEELVNLQKERDEIQNQLEHLLEKWEGLAVEDM